MEYDLLIRGATIVDGTGAEAFSGDVGVKDGLIAAVGALNAPAGRTIDADGLTLTPGFVDIHTHYDGQASWDSLLAPSSIHGVTSIGMGNCGVGFAPARPEWHERLIALLEGVEDIPGTALSEGLTWDWETFPEYLDALERRQYAVDVGAHMPHSALRAYVMGERGRDPAEAPTEDEIRLMEQATFEALEAGAIGFSTSRTLAHKDRYGAPINTLKAGAAELSAAARALRRSGHGVFQLVSDLYNTADDDEAEGELGLIESLAAISGRPLSFSVMQAPQSPLRYRHLLSRVKEFNAAGLPVRCQVAPRGVGVILGFRTTVNPFSEASLYREISAGTVDERIARLRTPEVRDRLIAEGRAGINTMIARTVSNLDQMFRMSDPVDYEPTPDASIGAEARRLGKDEWTHAYDVLLEDDGKRLLYFPVFNYVAGNFDAVEEMLNDPHTLYGLSDGGAHCGTICDASFPTTVIDLWRRGTRNGHRIPLETLVHGNTQRNAQHVGWLDRGVIAPGYKADINLIDLDALAVPPPELWYDLPAGGMRLIQKPRGYRWTIKSGEVTLEDGEWTGAAPGRLLRGEQVRGRA